MEMKTKLTFLTKLTAGGLVAMAMALWIQWLSGDPAFPKFPPGPVIFIAVAAIVIYGARWWWTPMIGALIGLLVTAGWFARLPQAMLRLNHPDEVGKFAAGIFIGSVLQISSLLLTDIAGLAATAQNFRRAGSVADSARMACRFFGGIFVVMGVLVATGGIRRQIPQPDASGVGRVSSGRQLPWNNGSEALLHRIRRLLSNSGDSRADDREPGDEQGVVLRSHASAHRRPHLPSGTRLHLPRHGVALGPPMGPSSESGLKS